MEKSADAFRTIGEVSEELGLPQHILRYWETRFPQLKPMQRAGNRRYYRPADVALVRQIHVLLNEQGYTVKGVQKLLSGKAGSVQAMPLAESSARPAIAIERAAPDVLSGLLTIRDRLSRALAEDDVAARVGV